MCASDLKHVSMQKSSAQMFTAALIIIPKSGDNTNAHQMNIGLMKFGLFLVRYYYPALKSPNTSTCYNVYELLKYYAK